MVSTLVPSLADVTLAALPGEMPKNQCVWPKASP